MQLARARGSHQRAGGPTHPGGGTQTSGVALGRTVTFRSGGSETSSLASAFPVDGGFAIARHR